MQQKRLSRALAALSSAPYAKADCAQQNPESRLEAVQDHRDRKSEASTCLAAAPAVLEERQAQTPHGEVRRSPQDRYGPHQDEHAVRVGRSLRTIESRFQRCGFPKAGDPGRCPGLQ